MKNKKIKVTLLGFQEKINGDYLILVNDENRNTFTFDDKKHNLELIKYLLENPEDKNFEIKVAPDIAKRAYKPIQKMLDFSW